MDDALIILWNKHKETLKQHYSCSIPEDVTTYKYYKKTLFALYKIVIENLVYYIFNAKGESMGLTNVRFDSRKVKYVNGYYDHLYELYIDDKGWLWTLIFFFDDYDMESYVRYDTKDEWICQLMSMSIRALKAFRCASVDREPNETLIIAKDAKKSHNINLIVDLSMTLNCNDVRIISSMLKSIGWDGILPILENKHKILLEEYLQEDSDDEPYFLLQSVLQTGYLALTKEDAFVDESNFDIKLPRYMPFYSKTLSGLLQKIQSA